MNRVLFFDTETTGRYDFKRPYSDPAQPNLCQLAAMVATRERVLAQMNFLIRPEGWEIAEEVTHVHGIDQVTATLAGVTRRTALACFNQLCLIADIGTAFNLTFDHNVLLTSYQREGRGHRMQLPLVCTMLAATPVCRLPSAFKGRQTKDQFKWPTLTEAYAFFHEGRTFDGAHDAMVDVQALAAVYWALEDRKALSTVA